MGDQFREVVIQRLMGICNLSPAQIELLESHYELLVRWNRVLNLTSIRTLAEAAERHYCESIFAALQLPRRVSIIDIGSGAGFPGIPMAIMLEDCRVTLVESHARKAVFLKEAARGLPNAVVVAGRVEELEGHFDWAVSRAVQFGEIATSIEKLAENVEVLSGDVRPDDRACFEWRKPIHMPWSERRFIWIAHVSRET